MQYTILELERIEKVLQAKLFTAEEAYQEELHVVNTQFKEHNKTVTFPDNETVREAYDTFKGNEDRLMFLESEVELFKSGVATLYSYWNYSVEIFIDNLREKIEKEHPEAKRYAINQDADGSHQDP